MDKKVAIGGGIRLKNRDWAAVLFCGMGEVYLVFGKVGKVPRKGRRLCLILPPKIVYNLPRLTNRSALLKGVQK